MKNLNIEELRIGNLFIWGEWEHKMEADDYMDMYVNGTDKVFGIPLTEEWLLKFGFKRWGNDPLIITTKYYEKLYAESKSEKFYFKIERFMPHDYYTTNHISIHNQQIHHVHQLQNLYFALTGTELQ